MSVPLDKQQFRMDGRHVALALATICAGMIAIGLVIEQQPLLAVGAITAPIAGFILLRRPNSVIPLVLFLIYSNAMVVAVRFHGVPSVGAMLVPAPLAIPLFAQLVQQRRPILTGPAFPWLLGLVIWQLISALLSRDPGRALDGVVSTALEGLLLYFLITNVIRNRDTLRQGVWALIAAGAFMGSISAYQQATRSFHTDLGGFGQLSGGPGFRVTEGRGTVQQRRLAGPIGEKNRYAQVMLVLIPLAVSRFWAHRDRRTRAIALFCALMIGIGGALTFSRSGAIAFVLMLCVAVPLRFVSRKQITVLLAGGLLVLIAVPQYRTRLATIPAALGIFSRSVDNNHVDGAVRGRATEMLAAARIAADHPVFGVGPELSSSYIREYGQAGGLRALEGRRESHCMFLELPAEIGLPGLLIFLCMLAATLRSLIQSSLRIRELDQQLSLTGSAFALAIVGYLVMGVFLHMSYVRYFWLLLALANSCCCVMRRVSPTLLRDRSPEVSA